MQSHSHKAQGTCSGEAEGGPERSSSFATNTRAVNDIAPSADWLYMAREMAIR